MNPLDKDLQKEKMWFSLKEEIERDQLKNSFSKDQTLDKNWLFLLGWENMQHKNITQKNAEITKDNIYMKTFKIEKARVEKE